MEQQKGGQVKSTSRAVRALRLQKGNLNFIGPGHLGPDKVCSSDILGQCQWAAEDGWAGQVVFKNGGGAFRPEMAGSLQFACTHQPVKIGRVAERAIAGFRLVIELGANPGE
ncbi:unnamed protein product [Linum tenue]|uniref:Uncharacterized protein n=1 Tax=Linum tenue TaxID=586396 RepID=A0AAV0RI28_9ROSI|nr:unnamed protein product [Linum tenue]